MGTWYIHGGARCQLSEVLRIRILLYSVGGALEPKNSRDGASARRAGPGPAQRQSARQRRAPSTSRRARRRRRASPSAVSCGSTRLVIGHSARSCRTSASANMLPGADNITRSLFVILPCTRVAGKLTEIMYDPNLSDVADRIMGAVRRPPRLLNSTRPTLYAPAHLSSHTTSAPKQPSRCEREATGGPGGPRRRRGAYAPTPACPPTAPLCSWSLCGFFLFVRRKQTRRVLLNPDLLILCSSSFSSHTNLISKLAPCEPRCALSRSTRPSYAAQGNSAMVQSAAIGTSGLRTTVRPVASHQLASRSLVTPS